MVFATVMSEFGNQTVLGFWIVQELALWHKDRRTGRWAIALRHHEWGFLLFFLITTELMFQELDAFLRPHRIHADLTLTKHRVVWDVAVAQQA